MEVLTDKTAQTRLFSVVTNIANTFPPQLQSIALALLNLGISGKTVTQAEAQGYVTKIKNLSTATKQTIFKKLPVLKKVMAKGGKLVFG
uniref:Uncharacterized protein n=1 Tax=Panagrolaimus davidi TaxID=227884 RepID=A0A914NZG2_9BILA